MEVCVAACNRRRWRGKAGGGVARTSAAKVVEEVDEDEGDVVARRWPVAWCERKKNRGGKCTGEKALSSWRSGMPKEESGKDWKLFELGKKSKFKPNFKRVLKSLNFWGFFTWFPKIFRSSSMHGHSESHISVKLSFLVCTRQIRFFWILCLPALQPWFLKIFRTTSMYGQSEFQQNSVAIDSNAVEIRKAQHFPYVLTEALVCLDYLPTLPWFLTWHWSSIGSVHTAPQVQIHVSVYGDKLLESRHGTDLWLVLPVAVGVVRQPFRETEQNHPYTFGTGLHRSTHEQVKECMFVLFLKRKKNLRLSFVRCIDLDEFRMVQCRGARAIVRSSFQTALTHEKKELLYYFWQFFLKPKPLLFCSLDVL